MPPRSSRAHETPATAAPDPVPGTVPPGIAVATAPVQAAPPPGFILVRLTIRPDADHHVMPSELEQLRAQGLLIEDDPAPSGAAVQAPEAGKDATA